MNKFCLTAGLYLLICSFTTAQVNNYKNSIRVGIDYMSLDAPDDLGLRYGIRYARHFIDDRVVIEGGLGYLNIKNRRLVANNFYFEGRPRQRVTADLTALYDLLGNSRQAFRLGGDFQFGTEEMRFYEKLDPFQGRTVNHQESKLLVKRRMRLLPGFT